MAKKNPLYFLQSITEEDSRAHISGVTNHMTELFGTFMKKMMVVTIVLALTSCNSRERFPIEEEKLIDVLVDTHFADAALVHVNQTKKDSMAVFYYNQIYERNGITAAQLDTSLAILRRDPLTTWKIYQKVKLKIEEHAVPHNSE